MNRLGLALLACGAGMLAMWGCVLPTFAASETIVVTLTSRHRSGVSAKASLKPNGAATVITIAISGSGTYLPDIRAGTCDRGATVPEIPLAVGSVKQASVTTVDLPLASLVSGSRVVMLHRADGTLGDLGPNSAVACGELKLFQTNVAVGPPVTGVGPGVSQRVAGNLVAGLATAAVGVMAVAWFVTRRGTRS